MLSADAIWSRPRESGVHLYLLPLPTSTTSVYSIPIFQNFFFFFILSIKLGKKSSMSWWPELEKVPSWTSGSRRGTPAVITQEARPSLPLAAPAVLPGGDLYWSPEGLPGARRVTIPDYRALSYRLERRLDFSFHLGHWEILQDGASECLCGFLWAWPFALCPCGNAQHDQQKSKAWKPT